MAMPPNMLARLATLTLLAAAACSTVPDASWPAQQAGELEVLYDFADGAPRIFRVPASDDDLTVLWLEADPPVVTERFVDGERIWIAPEDLDELRVRCGYRLFGAAGARDPLGTSLRVTERFPGGTVVDHRLKP